MFFNFVPKIPPHSCLLPPGERGLSIITPPSMGGVGEGVIFSFPFVSQRLMRVFYE